MDSTIVIRDTIYKTEIITVYKDSINKSELVDLYQNVLQNQSANFTILITTLLGITVALLGASWAWNFFYAKKQIHQEVEEITEINRLKIQAQLEEQMNNKFAELEKKLTHKIEENDRNVQEKFSKTEHQFNEKFENLKNEINKELIKNESEIARNFAVSTQQYKRYTASLSWWIIALEGYVKLDMVNMIRLAVDTILDILKKEDWYNNPYKEFDINKEIQKIETNIPAILSNEKKEIISILKSKLPKT
jgi:hypothetical protein